MWGAIASAVVGSLFSYKAAQQQRNQAIKDQDNQFVRMRNAAQRAGFNPLTVLRNTGGQGFTGLPTISKAAAFGNAAAGIFDAYRQAPIDKYNKQVRDLTLKSMKADIGNTLANTRYTGILSKQAGYSGGASITGNVLTAGANVGNTTGKISEAILLPGTDKTLDEVLAQTPVEVRVTKTGDGSYVNNTLTAGLYPLVTPMGNTIFVPWNPEDADIGAIAGGISQYSGTKLYDFGKNVGQKLDEWRFQRQFSRAVDAQYK